MNENEQIKQAFRLKMDVIQTKKYRYILFPEVQFNACGNEVSELSLHKICTRRHIK